MQTEPQDLAREIGIDIRVYGLPPGTIKWDKIERKLFSFISLNRWGRSLWDFAAIIRLIAATAAEAGLKVYCSLDETFRAKGIKPAQEAIHALNIRREDFHGEPNGTIRCWPGPKPMMAWLFLDGLK